MRVITIATHRNDDLERLLISARRFNINVELIGEGREYLDHYVKTDWLIEYLATLDPEEIVLYTDGYDSVILRDTNYMEEEFLKLNHPIVFGTEQNFNVEASLFRKFIYYLNYPKGKKPYRYLNAGGWIGRAGYAKDLLSKVVGGDDQSLLLKYLTKHKNALAHDIDQNIFSCMAGRSGMEDHDYSLDDNGLVVNNVTKSRPAILHCAGKNFYGMYKVLSQFNYFPKETFSEQEMKRYRKFKFWNTLTAYTTADNYLFHLLLKSSLILLGLIAVFLIVASIQSIK
ncbi:MAG: glycosyltransferase domain-containing protein [Cyclobacteriaceae bacterium]